MNIARGNEVWNQIGKLGTLGTRNTVGQRVALTQICIFDPVFLSVKKEGKGGSESIALPVVFFREENRWSLQQKWF